MSVLPATMFPAMIDNPCAFFFFLQHSLEFFRVLGKIDYATSFYIALIR